MLIKGACNRRAGFGAERLPAPISDVVESTHQIPALLLARSLSLAQQLHPERHRIFRRLDDLPALGQTLLVLFSPSTHVRLMPNAVQAVLASTLVLLGGAVRATRTQRDRSAPDTLGAVTMFMFPGRIVRTTRTVGSGSTPAAGAFVTQVLVFLGRAMRAARSVGDRAAIKALVHWKSVPDDPSIKP